MSEQDRIADQIILGLQYLASFGNLDVVTSCPDFSRGLAQPARLTRCRSTIHWSREERGVRPRFQRVRFSSLKLGEWMDGLSRVQQRKPPFIEEIHNNVSSGGGLKGNTNKTA
jgi:hypothetical protein